MKVNVICKQCGKLFQAKPSEVNRGKKYCSMSCCVAAKKHLPFISKGYRYIWNGTRFVLEHRHVIELHIGRKLSCDEHVHHINRIKTDNRIENLLLMDSSSTHQLLHGKENFDVYHKKVPCNFCGKEVMRTLSEFKKHNESAYCSKECFRKSKSFLLGCARRKERTAMLTVTRKTARCKTCGLEKPTSDFRLRKDGSIFTYTCKQCTKIKQHDYYTVWYSNPINQEYAKTKASDRYAQLKKDVMLHAI